MCTHSSARMILGFFAQQKSINGWSAYSGCVEVLTNAVVTICDNHTQYVNASFNAWHVLSMFQPKTCLYFFTSHFSSSPSSPSDQLRAIFFRPESTKQQHGCPGRKWWRNRPTWKEPAAPDKCLLLQIPEICCLSKVWIFKKNKMPMPVILAKFWMMHDVSTRTLTQTIENTVSMHWLLHVCVSENWMRFEKLPININSCLHVVLNTPLQCLYKICT